MKSLQNYNSITNTPSDRAEHQCCVPPVSFKAYLQYVESRERWCWLCASEALGPGPAGGRYATASGGTVISGAIWIGWNKSMLAKLPAQTAGDPLRPYLGKKIGRVEHLCNSKTSQYRIIWNFSPQQEFSKASYRMQS